MSHTIIPDHRDRALADENIVNRLQRHCRVKTVQWKARPPINYRDLFFRLPPQPPFYINTVPPQCKQCEGKACGNVACPMRLVATCGPTIAPHFGTGGI